MSRADLLTAVKTFRDERGRMQDTAAHLLLTEVACHLEWNVTAARCQLADRARALRDDPVYVLSATQTLSPYREPMGIYTGGEMLELFPPAAADRLFSQAGVSRKDIDVAELYDATSYMTLRSLESFGFAADGAGWRYVLDHGTGPDSPLPVNTHGGHLSEAYLHGMNGILEAVRQLRGTACNQVDGAEVALVGAPAGSATILAR